MIFQSHLYLKPKFPGKSLKFVFIKSIIQMNLFVKFWIRLELLLQYEKKKRLVKKSFEILGIEKEYDKKS